MQQQPPTTPKPNAVTIYGPIALSGLVILFVWIAFLMHDIDWITTISITATILAANGAYLNITQSPNAQLVQHLTSHIQALHSLQFNAMRASRPYTPPPTPIRLPTPPQDQPKSEV